MSAGGYPAMRREAAKGTASSSSAQISYNIMSASELGKAEPSHNEQRIIITNEIRDMDKLYDVIIIGGGPAGLTAAIYLTRARYRVLVLEKEQFGGQITISDEIVNYPGVGKTSGKELTATMYRQAEHFGAEFLMAEATALEVEEDVKTVHTNRGDFQCLGVLLATGAHPRNIGFAGEVEYKGKGVAYCATCDGEFFTGKEVFVVGGGFAAAEEGVFLTKFASHVTILVRGEDFTCAKAVSEPAKNHPKVTVLTNVTVEKVTGERGLNYIRYRNSKTGEVTEYRAKEGDHFGVFVFAGYAPASELVKDIVELSDQGYIVTDYTKKTSVDGVYAAGDICIKPLRQVITATGEGALAATELEKYVAVMHEKTGLQPQRTKRMNLSETENMTLKPELSERNDTSVGEVEESKNIVTKSKNEGNTKQTGMSEVFDEETKAQLQQVFNRMESPLVLKLHLEQRSVSAELKKYMEAFMELTDKLTMTIEEENASSEEAPYVNICRSDGSATGLTFHGVPGGHECTSFVLGLYNVSGPGQKLSEDIRNRILAIDKKINIKILVSLTCTMCPDLVTAVWHIAALNPNITADVYDIHHFEKLKEEYQVMSVSCMVINGKEIFFGRKNIEEVLEIL